MIRLGDLPIFVLKYADDLVLLSPTAEHLQQSVDRTCAFLKERGLIMNLTKSVCMVVKGMSRENIALKITSGSANLEQVFEFRYLGIVLNENLNLTKTQKHLADSSEKAFYAFQQKLADLPPGIPYKIAEKLFDCSVVSIANFGSKVCGPNKSTDPLQVRFFRNFFHLKRTTPTDAYHHLNLRYPLHFRQAKLFLNFVKRAAERPAESIVHQALLCAAETAKKRRTSWLRRGMKLVQSLAGIDWGNSCAQTVGKLSQINVNHVMQ